MNEIALSNDLNQIELDIKYQRNVAGQAIWEIGRRLNHVKENDLVHGEWMDWLDKIQIEHTAAKRMMKITKELPNSATLHHLGESALYLISTLPEEEREQEHITADGETKTPGEMTVRELQDLKKKLERAEAQLEIKERTNKSQSRDIDNLIKENKELKDKEPKVVEVEVPKEVQHPHIDDLRSDNTQLSKALKQAQSEAESAIKRNEFIEKEYKSLLEQREEVNEKSDKYDQLTEAIKNAEGKLTSTQKLVSDYRDIMKILKSGNELLLKTSGLLYMNIADTVNDNNLVSREFDQLIYNLKSFINDLSGIRNQTIYEGETTDD